MRPSKSSTPASRLWLILAGVAAGFGVLVWITRRRRFQPQATPAQVKPFKPPTEGLSDEQAARLYTGQRAQLRLQLEKQAKLANLRTSAVSVFNLTMLVMVVSQVWLKDPLGALITLCILIFNIFFRTWQQNNAARQVGQVALQAQPFATAVRGGRLRSISLDEVVVGDVLVAGPGDEILANGVILESPGLTILVTQHQEEIALQLRKGDRVQAGSVCETGQAAYRVSQLPPVYPAASIARRKSASAKETTHLEDILLRALYLLLAFVGLFYVLLLIEVFRIDVLSPEQMSQARGVMGLIFGLAPSGFFLLIMLNYAKGTIDLARLGALVRDKRAIETLADLTILCVHQKSILSNLDVQTEMIPFEAGAPALAENFARRALGDISRSIAGAQVILRAISGAFDGEPRRPQQQAFFFSLNGWGAVNFTYPDLTGTFVIGYPEILEPHLAHLPSGSASEQEASSQSKPSLFGRLRNRFVRPQNEDDEAKNSIALDQNSAELVLADQSPTEPPTAGETAPPVKLFSRMRSSVQTTLKKIRDASQRKSPSPVEESSILELLFAYLPEPSNLYGPDGIPRCPTGLIPVCRLHFKEKIQTDLADIVNSIRGEGIGIKFFASEADDQVEAAVRRIGLLDDNDPGAIVTASELAKMDQEHLAQAVKRATLFKDLNRYQMGMAINLLRKSGETVGVLGSSVMDLQPMRNASLTIARQGGDQAILTQADIVLLKGYRDAFRETLAHGQQIVHGTLDVIKLNLVQIGYVLLLLIGMYVMDRTRFFYTGSQGSMAALFTTTLPAIFLSLWAPTGAVNRGSMRLHLARFILPSAVTIALAVLILDRLFLSMTSSPAYTRHLITHALVCMGLLLVVFTRPTTKWLAGGSRLTNDLRPTIMAFLMFLLWNVFVWIGLVQKYLHVAPLASLRDYLAVWIPALVWGLLTQLIWRLPWLNPGVDYLSAWLETKEEPELVEARAPVALR